MFSWSGFRMNLSMTNAKVWIASEPTVIITLEIPYLLSNDYKDWFTGDLREFKFRHYLTVIPHHVGYMPIFRNRMNLWSGWILCKIIAIFLFLANSTVLFQFLIIDICIEISTTKTKENFSWERTSIPADYHNNHYLVVTRSTISEKFLSPI